MQETKKTADKSFPTLTGEHPIYRTPTGDTIRIVSVFCGEKSASELIHQAAVRKILYEGKT